MTCPETPGDPMDGKTVLVTGANSGIGKETTRALAGLGAEVIMLCRSERRGEKARREIVEDTGNDALELVLADLASQEQVRQAAATVAGSWDQLDVLINNAGAVLSDRQITEDGNEAQFAINHLAPFLLTHDLLELLEDAADEHGRARVVTVASDAHWNVKARPERLQSQEGRYRSFSVYSRTKLYNILFTRELADRLDGTGVTANCLHPGVIGSRFGSHGPWYVRAFMAVARPLLKSPVDGAKTSVHLAASHEVADTTGAYFKDCQQAASSKLARDDALQERLWEASQRLTGAADWPKPSARAALPGSGGQPSG